MPRRSNLFQQVMTHIYSQMVPKGATVTESAMLREHKTGQEREVDILIAQNVDGNELRISVEVRDRTAVQWIDCMIGKYLDLPIHKKVAVSRSGFSKGARAKAEAHGIETKTLTQILTTDWPSEFTRLGFAYVERNDSIVDVAWDLDPPMERKPVPKDQYIDATGTCRGSLAELVHGLGAHSSWGRTGIAMKIRQVS